MKDINNKIPEDIAIYIKKAGIKDILYSEELETRLQEEKMKQEKDINEKIKKVSVA